MTDQSDNKEPIFEEPTKADPKVARRQRLLANLEKGRKTALENRKKKAMYKKLKKQDEVDEMDLAIQEKMLKKAQEKSEVLTLREELEQLRMEVKSKAQPKKEARAPTPPPREPTPRPPTPPPPRPPTPPVVISTYSTVPW